VFYRDYKIGILHQVSTRFTRPHHHLHLNHSSFLYATWAPRECSLVRLMDGFDATTAPPAYQEVAWIANIFVFGMGAGWLINYAGMVYKSFEERTYCMAIMPLCCNIAWEVAYGLVYPSKSYLEHGVFLSGLAVNLCVIYTAITFGPNEWTNAPLVARNLPLIFVLGILGFLTGHLALAAEIGPSLAYSWGAVFCQLLLSVGGLCQLLTRGSTRGNSYTLW
jgi:paspaline synthase